MPIDRYGFWYPPATVHPSELHAPIPAKFACRNPLPPPTTSSPGELLSRYYNPEEPDWTDPDGILSKQLVMIIQYPQYVAAPIGSAGLIGEWPRPNGLAAEPVPTYDPDLASEGMQLAVEFRTRARDCPSTGIPMRAIYTRDVASMEGADDVIFSEAWGGQVSFMVVWPGYEPGRAKIRTVGSNGRSLTRFEIAYQIVRVYARFFQKVENEKRLPSEVGFFNIALHQGANSRTDSHGVQLHQLHLIRIRITNQGHWVADVDVV